MEFEWDPAKDDANRRKHGFGFELAVRAFKGQCLTLPARNVGGEARSLMIGRIEDLLVIAVVHTDRQGRTRLISARPASRREREIFHGFEARET
ncbi:BrnT family toxin [Maricaulis sp.]|uniref:BrnT family toxin n=1 Tax=Maricaulis sp. TaxID=1486257 RepID=UPI003A904C74